LKTGLRVSNPTKEHENMKKTSQKPVNTHKEAKKGNEISNRGYGCL